MARVIAEAFEQLQERLRVVVAGPVGGAESVSILALSLLALVGGLDLLSSTSEVLVGDVGPALDLVVVVSAASVAAISGLISKMAATDLIGLHFATA